MAIDILEAIRGVRNSQYGFAASYTLLLYDIMITLPEEIELVWSSKLTVGTALYFVNRYTPPITFMVDSFYQLSYRPTPQFCRVFETLGGMLGTIVIAVVQAVLILRTHALYRSRAVLALLSCLAFGSIVTIISCVIYVTSPVRRIFIDTSLIGLNGCLSQCPTAMCSTLLVVFWIPFIVFEIVIFVLTVWKSYSTYRGLGATGDRSHTLTAILLRDGFIYFLAMLVVSLLNFFFFLFNNYYVYLTVSLLRSLQPVMCSRMLLNIRGLLGENGSMTTKPVSTIQFGAPQPRRPLNHDSLDIRSSDDSELTDGIHVESYQLRSFTDSSRS